MTTNNMAHRLSFPLTRKFTQKMVLAGAVITNALTTEYLNSHVQLEDETKDDDDTVSVGFYL